jgi:hypothetical protein
MTHFDDAPRREFAAGHPAHQHGREEEIFYGTREPNDICFHPRSNNVAFRGIKLIARVERLDYWDGED